MNPPRFRRLLAVAVLVGICLAGTGCGERSSLGGFNRDDGFTIQARLSAMGGQDLFEKVDLKINRGHLFHQNVRLEIEASPGISVVPTAYLFKDGESGSVTLKVRLSGSYEGPYNIHVTAWPQTGMPASMEIPVTESSD